MERTIPFGIHYHDRECHFKLRFHPKKFFHSEARLSRYNKHRLTQNGYVIFELKADVTSQLFTDVSKDLQHLNSLKPAP